MKNAKAWRWLLAVTLALGFSQFGLARATQTPSQDPSAQQQPDQNTGQQKQSQTFKGQIVQTKSGQYALLVNKSTGTGFYLDDQDRAKKYDGQNVQVTGTLVAQNNTIHVSDIKPAM